MRTSPHRPMLQRQTAKRRLVWGSFTSSRRGCRRDRFSNIRGVTRMTVQQHICGMTATELVVAVRTKQLSPVEVVDAHLERIEILEPSIHAFCTMTADMARKHARDVEARILRGEEVGALAGVPVGIKDLVCTAGIKTASGSAAYQDFVPDEDDVVVE